MTKRIFRSVCFVALVVFIASTILVVGVLYEYFSDVQQSQLKMQTNLAAQGVTHEGAAYFDGLRVMNYRITWIDTDGSVLYDSMSDSGEIGNHLDREEVQTALAKGTGRADAIR